MTRIDLEQIAAEFGLVVEKSDVGTYKQWKNAQLDLYLPGNREAGHLVRGCTRLWRTMFIIRA